MIGDSRFHCRRNAKRLMDAAEIIMHIVNGDRGDMVLNLFRVTVSQASEAAHVHSHEDSELAPQVFLISFLHCRSSEALLFELFVLGTLLFDRIALENPITSRGTATR